MILMRRFPFLIGRIRTKHYFEYWKKNAMFPFLIGRIRTIENAVKISLKTGKFPFLIGRIRTNNV